MCPTPEKPAGYYLELEAQHNHTQIVDILLADPAKVGALRIDPRSEDKEYLEKTKTALAADVDAELWQAAMHLFTPDAPAAMYGDVLEFNASFAKLQRTFVHCTADNLVDASVSNSIIQDMNTAWPNHPAKLLELKSSHEVIFSIPDQVAELLVQEVKH